MTQAIPIKSFDELARAIFPDHKPKLALCPTPKLKPKPRRKIIRIGHSSEFTDYSAIANPVFGTKSYIEPIMSTDSIRSRTLELLSTWRYKATSIQLMLECGRLAVKNSDLTYNVHLFDDKSQPNTDIPDEIFSFEQGQAQRLNVHLDPDHTGKKSINTMNNAHFRELCVVRNNKLHRLAFKDLYKPPSHLDPNWLQPKLQISRPMAIQLVAALNLTDKLGLEVNWKTACKLFFGTKISKAKLAQYPRVPQPVWCRPINIEPSVPYRSGETYAYIEGESFKYDGISKWDKVTGYMAQGKAPIAATCGIIGTTQKQASINRLGAIAKELNTTTVTKKDFVPQTLHNDDTIHEAKTLLPIELRAKYFYSNLMEPDALYYKLQYKLPDNRVAAYRQNEGAFIEYNEEPEWDQVNELEHNGQSSNPFTTKPLFSGDESLPHEITAEIRTADLQQLNKIQQRFYPSKSDWTGVTYPPEYKWMSTLQRNMARWTLIPERKESLSKQTKQAIGKDGQTVIKWVKDLGRTHQASGLIYAYAAGEAYNLFGVTLEFETKPSPEEVNYIWSVYNTA